jgi:hypothetical protein
MAMMAGCAVWLDNLAGCNCLLCRLVMLAMLAIFSAFDGYVGWLC